MCTDSTDLVTQSRWGRCGGGPLSALSLCLQDSKLRISTGQLICTKAGARCQCVFVHILGELKRPYARLSHYFAPHLSRPSPCPPPPPLLHTSKCPRTRAR
eukprot:52448-Pleurochrysis_carterae.AAC.1